MGSLVGVSEPNSNGNSYQSVINSINSFITGFNSDYVLEGTNLESDESYKNYIVLSPGIYDFEEWTTEENTVFLIPSYPEEISDSTNARWATENVLGRPVPVASFLGTDYRTISFNFDLHREMLGGLPTNINTVEKFLYGIKQAVYPADVEQVVNDTNYTGFVPRTAFVKFGAFCARGYITNVGHTWKKPLVYNKERNCYQYQVCNVNISMNAIDMSEGSY